MEKMCEELNGRIQVNRIKEGKEKTTFSYKKRDIESFILNEYMYSLSNSSTF